MGRADTKYKNDFQKEKYDRIIVNVNKGEKDAIEQHRERMGYSSLNKYITDLIRKDINQNNVIFDKNDVGEVVSVNLKEVKADKVTKKSGKATVKVDF